MKIENAKVTWLDSGLPYSTEYQDIYYSRDDELAESQHVFLEANKLRQRWKQERNTDVFHIGELGFGSGLNFLQVIQAWQELEQRPSRLHYLAFEKHPLTHDQLRKIHQRWPSLRNQSTAFLAQYTDHGEGCHRILLDHGIILDLYFGDALEQLNQRLVESCPAIQCWFLDGFSPANNSDLWEEPLMQSLASCSDENTTLSSYSVAGKVRSALKNAGFEVSKIEGFGRKRHCLSATMIASVRPLAILDPPPLSDSPWFTLPQNQLTGNTAVVVGAGLAGCSTAHSLARRGWNVTVVDAGSDAASGASGNSQLALRCRLFNAASSEARFFLHAYLFTLRQLELLRVQEAIAWTACGVLQLENAMNKRNPLLLKKIAKLYSNRMVQLLSKSEASKVAGVGLTEGAWFFPSGGRLAPTSLCHAYLKHDNIDCHFNARVKSLSRSNDRWQIAIDQSETIEADAVVIANSHSATELAQFSGLPLQILRGQTTEIPATKQSGHLESVVSGGRTVFPSCAGRHLLSASYSNSIELGALPENNLQNITIAASNFTDKQLLEANPVLERVSLRCNSPDRMPLVGQAPNLLAMKRDFADLAKNAKTKFTSAGKYHSGLYLNVAHGSNGLASCPISAEFIASLITGENLPLSRDVADALNPSRFLIRSLKKQK